MGQDRSSVSCGNEGEMVARSLAEAVAGAAIAGRQGKSAAEHPDVRELVEAVAASVVTHAARIEDLRRRVEALEARAGPDFEGEAVRSDPEIPVK